MFRLPLQSLLEGQTLDEVKDGLIEACDRLTALDAFSSVDVLADKSADVRLSCVASWGASLTSCTPLRRTFRTRRTLW